MKQYELPYNFAYDYVGKLARYSELFPYVRCIYLPAYVDDAMTTRRDIPLRDEYPKSYDEYLIRLKTMQQLGLPLCILMHRNATLEILEKYYALGIRMFTINDDALAIAARTRHNDISLTLSVTRCLTEKDLVDGDFSMYDDIVLFFWFNRHLSVIKNLPKKYHYILICNTGCYYDCHWHDQHWFAETAEEEIKATDKCRACVHSVRDTIYVEPENLSYFDPYISSYKLTDRLFDTDRIITDLKAYAGRNIGAVKRSEDFYNVDS